MADEPVMKSDLDALQVRLVELIEAQELRLLERIEKSETRLLNEFRKWVVPFTARTRVFEAISIGLTDCMSMVARACRWSRTEVGAALLPGRR
jgi:hypothetical protein